MKLIAHTALVAFLASMLTLAAVVVLAPDDEMVVEEVDGDLPRITPEELAEHDHARSCWKAINGKVYDVTEYISNHPTEPSVILRWCGRESSEAWTTKGYGRPHSGRAEAMLEQYVIGRFEQQ